MGSTSREEIGVELVNTELVLCVAGLTAAAIEVGKKKLAIDLSRIGPIIALAIAMALTAAASLLGTPIPEGANWFAWVGLHGFVAALISMGGYDLAKRAFTKPGSTGG